MQESYEGKFRNDMFNKKKKKKILSRQLICETLKFRRKFFQN